MLLTHIPLFRDVVAVHVSAIKRFPIFHYLCLYMSFLSSFLFVFFFGALLWALNIIISWRRTSILFFPCFFCALYTKNSSVAHVASFLQSRGGSKGGTYILYVEKNIMNLMGV